MNIYIIKQEMWQKQENQSIWKLASSDNYEVCTSYKKACNFIKHWEWYRQEKFEMKLFPRETYTREYNLEDYNYREILVIEKWEL